MHHTRIKPAERAGRLLSEKAAAVMDARDREFEDWSRRKGHLTSEKCFGFVPTFRDVNTGAIQHGNFHATRSAALEAAYDPERIARCPDTITERIERVTTSLRTVGRHDPLAED